MSVRSPDFAHASLRSHWTFGGLKADYDQSADTSGRHSSQVPSVTSGPSADVSLSLGKPVLSLNGQHLVGKPVESLGQRRPKASALTRTRSHDVNGANQAHAEEQQDGIIVTTALGRRPLTFSIPPLWDNAGRTGEGPPADDRTKMHAPLRLSMCCETPSRCAQARRCSR